MESVHGPRIRLWVKLAALAALGVVATHLVQVGVSTRVAHDALLAVQDNLGRGMARLVASAVAEMVLVDDRSALDATVTEVASVPGISYCFIERDGAVISSSFTRGTPIPLIALRRHPDKGAAAIVRLGAQRVLDIAHPILDGRAGTVRIGLDMDILSMTARHIYLLLGIVAAAVIAAGVFAAFVVGKAIASPIDEMLAAADRFDPAVSPSLVTPRGTDEIAELAVRFNRMMSRLHESQIQQILAQQKQADTERLAALGTLVAGVAHEVNNPLAGIKNCLRLLRRDDQFAQEKRAEYFGFIDEGIQRIESVMRQLLDFGRVHAPQVSLVDVDAIVASASALLLPIFARRQIRFSAEACSSAIMVDRNQVVQALLNLLLNADYVTAPGGEIRVRFRRRPGFVGIAVEDDGPGIPAVIRDRVCDPFFTTKPEGEGTGLGLSVTKTILELHGGELTLECPDRGTIATMWLPSQEGQPDHPASV